MKMWRKSRSKRRYRVDFALGPDIVRLVSTFVYYRSLESPRGRVYYVESIATGRQDIVGVEYLERVKGEKGE